MDGLPDRANHRIERFALHEIHVAVPPSLLKSRMIGWLDWGQI